MSTQRQRLLGQLQKTLTATEENATLITEREIEIKGGEGVFRVLRHFGVVLKNPGLVIAVFADITDIQTDPRKICRLSWTIASDTSGLFRLMRCRQLRLLVLKPSGVFLLM